ncbi:class I poly(R)-hydroxyalkanoic acid synthase [soil metagenome]
MDGGSEPIGASFNVARLDEVRRQYLDGYSALVRQSLEPAPEAAPLKDRRFAADVWLDHGIYEFLARAYLLQADAMRGLVDAVETDAKTRMRMRFAVDQYVDALAPSNYLALNPDAQRELLKSSGDSLRAGIENLVADVSRGRISMTDEAGFEVGRNLATTPGQVVFENEFFQLIQYAPATAQVGAVPLLFIPPCINKYYILDLQPANSLVRYAVEQGHTVFMLSWRNPDESCALWTWDDYIEQAAITAIETVSAIASRSAAKPVPVNLVGFCVGGTIAATAAAVLTARRRRLVASLTLLTTFLDFADTGVLDIFVDEAQVAQREQQLANGGLLKAQELAATFSLLRPNDLIWPYVVGNYLKGERPAAFDLLYWNADSTHLPGPMYCWYLRNTYLENKLRVPGATTVAGKPLDLGVIDCPVFVYASRDDHIVPWKSGYASLEVLRGADLAKSAFVLGASGHVAGVINPAAGGKRSHQVSGPSKSARSRRFPASADDWLAASSTVAGSWWPSWQQWLEPFAGPRIKAPASAGNRKFPAIEAAPGRYVKQRVV